ncbi:putative regulator of Ras-like GTPase activity (Roadblock/LC7/MglB family) [Ancylobacter sp. 3268]|uniref:hypothetical protein n=1 Tax=Ancylobacter sp. 3268 TaxID=2817752 RepID=UPI00285A81F2|nr:hypothetical protein [Ancylobacter sp. 3268]MDR6950727.1 putative regulator of Ras-like GTPase activity (Roadblock/LC7/MglB family) [Ancylobacter sp. 3268]
MSAAFADPFMKEVTALVAEQPELSPLDAGVLIALVHGVASDTRSFARLFGIAHALVLRAASELEDRFGLVATDHLRVKTQRRRLVLTEAGHLLLSPR